MNPIKRAVHDVGVGLIPLAASCEKKQLNLARCFSPITLCQKAIGATSSALQTKSLGRIAKVLLLPRFILIKNTGDKP